MTAKPRQSFKMKLCVGVFAVAAATFALVFAVAIYFVRNEVRGNLDALVDSKLDYALRAIDEGLMTTKVSGENLLSIHQTPLVSAHPDSIYALCEHFLQSNPRIQGVAIGYEPGVVKGHDKGFAPYVMHSGDSFIRRNLAETKKYREHNWYKVAHDTKKPYWSKPFKESNGTIITSYNIPLINKRGGVDGVLAVDLNLNILSDSLQKLRPYPSAMLAVLDEDGTFIAHPNKDYIMKESLQSVIENSEYAPDPRILSDIKARKRDAEIYYAEDGKHYIYYAPVASNGWTVTLEVPRSEVAGGYYQMFVAIIIVMIIGIVLLILVSLLVINRLTRPLESFAEAARQISHGDFHVELPLIRDHNELYDLRAALVSMDMSLDRHVKELEATTAARATMESELNVARKIQMAMLPKVFPPYPERHEIDIYASLTPAKAVGGDLYDFQLDGDDMYFCIGDVAGKGIPASLVMAITLASFRIAVTQCCAPAKIAATINNVIANNNSENMFVTMFIGKCNLRTGELTCCNCGHNPPATNGRIADTETMNVTAVPDSSPDGSAAFAFMKHVPTNLPIGVIPDFEYQEVTMHIKPGVSMFLYTDGVTEAESKTKELFGEERLIKRLCEISNSSTASEITNHVINDVSLHAKGVEQSDDITVLCVKYTSPSPSQGGETQSNRSIHTSPSQGGETQSNRSTHPPTPPAAPVPDDSSSGSQTPLTPQPPTLQMIYRLIINNKVEEMSQLQPFIEKLSEAFGIPQEMIFQLNLALDEALTNSVQYAYSEGAEGKIALEASSDGIHVIFRLIDRGEPFDPTTLGDDVDTTLSVEERPIGGLGVFLIKQMMDEVTYQRQDDYNILIMKKKLGTTSPNN